MADTIENPEEEYDEYTEYTGDTDDSENDDNNFDEVLQLTEYTETDSLAASNTYIAAEYTNIDVGEANINHQKIAKNLVQKITKFIFDFNDVQLTEDHKRYVKAIADLQVNHLADLLSLTAINKQMLDNMVRRVNAVQAEDYAMIAVYNQLANQHLKFHKELQSTYKNIPVLIKKMRMDVMDTENLLEKPSEEVITEDYGTLQFNNTKDMLKDMRDKQAAKKLAAEQNANKQ